MQCRICNRELNKLEQMIAYRAKDVVVCRGCCSNIYEANGMKPLKDFVPWKFGLKVFFGIVFILSLPGQTSVGSGLIALAIGVGLLAWAIIPIAIEKSRCDSVVAKTLLVKDETDNTRHVCERCGGISRGNVCEYCGSPL